MKSYHKSFETQYYIFRYNLGTFQIWYLDIPIHCRRLSNADWLKIEEGFEKRLSCWNGKNLPTGGRLALFLFLLVYVPMYIMSFFTIPKGVIKNWITLGLNSFGSVMTTRENMVWLNGISCVNPKNKGD